MNKWTGRLAVLLAIFAACSGLFVGIAYADASSSAHYTFENSDLGGGGLIPSTSTDYTSVLSAGDNAVSSGTGNSASTHYQVQAGSQAPKDPTLSIAIVNGTASFNTLFGPTVTATATAQFSVVDYTSYGYVVQIVGNTPNNGTHSIPAMNNGSGGATTSSPGNEQFGINLVQNTTPSVGSAPNYGQFGAATAAPEPNYNTANQFYYSSGDSIASSPKSSGQITYTISYMVNVNSITPGGQYSSNQSIICTGTY
jgi:hypothetical protein